MLSGCCRTQGFSRRDVTVSRRQCIQKQFPDKLGMDPYGTIFYDKPKKVGNHCGMGGVAVEVLVEEYALSNGGSRFLVYLVT